jgi:hypothetical protein
MQLMRVRARSYQALSLLALLLSMAHCIMCLCHCFMIRVWQSRFWPLPMRLVLPHTICITQLLSLQLSNALLLSPRRSTRFSSGVIAIHVDLWVTQDAVSLAVKPAIKDMNYLKSDSLASSVTAGYSFPSWIRLVQTAHLSCACFVLSVFARFTVCFELLSSIRSEDQLSVKHYQIPLLNKKPRLVIYMPHSMKSVAHYSRQTNPFSNQR